MGRGGISKAEVARIARMCDGVIRSPGFIDVIWDDLLHDMARLADVAAERTHECEWCGDDFISIVATARHCSHACAASHAASRRGGVPCQP